MNNQADTNELKLEKIIKALEKKALGGKETEEKQVLEYNEETKEYIIKRRDITTKNYMPDTQACIKLIELYQNNNNNDYAGLTQEELLKEKERLLNEFYRNNNLI